jgi:NAD(P)-dependent dehydrogenase (short-subunit alcohol dehydrogenase family)
MRSVLITGAGRGIGRTTALRLAAAGWDVYAGVRSAGDATKLLSDASQRLAPLILDVTSAADIKALDSSLPERLDAVVNNAGIAVGGPVETVEVEQWRRQFEVNVVGQVAVTQAVLPRLRAARGRIVLVSSLSGRISTPMTGPYNASKFAIEAIGDALRVELKPWGVRVSLVEPAQTDTDMWRLADNVVDETVAGMSPEHRELYRKHIVGMRRTVKLSQRIASSPDGVAAAIERALTARRPRARYVVGAAPKAQAFITGLTPTPVQDASLRALLGVPRRP